jgi:hypothetical protein
MGLGGGTAAALAARENKKPKDIDIHELQKTLVSQGVFLNK